MVASSAHWIAAVRARESERPDRLFDDPFARELAGDLGFRMMARSEAGSGGERPFVPIRVRWFDDAIEAAVAEGIDQVVLLGSGMDTRPYRLRLGPAVDFYELDRPEVLAVKAPVLAPAEPRCRRYALAADLAGDWTLALRHNGFDLTRRTVWAAEGLAFYLTEAANVDLLRQAAALSAPGSRFLLDTVGEAGLDGPAMQPYLEHCRRHDLPLPFGTDDPAGLLAAGGWMAESVVNPGAPSASYGRFARPGRWSPAGITLSVGSVN